MPVTVRMLRTTFLLVFAWLLLPVAIGAGTPAGTNIQNIATASYVDSAGIARTTQSNQVVTVVQQVYSLSVLQNSLDAFGDPTSIEGDVATYSSNDVAAPGTASVFPYDLINTGNGTDTFALAIDQGIADTFTAENVEIYLDANCNGVIDTGETAITSITLDADETACLLVRAFVPASGTVNGDTANVNLTVTSDGDNTVSDTDNWSQVISQTQADIDITKAPSTTNPVPGEVVTYTISGTNTGGQAAGEVTDVVTVDGVLQEGVLVRDLLPTGLTFDGNWTIVVPGGVSSDTLYSTDGGATWTATVPGDLTTVNAVAILLHDGVAGTNDAFFAGGASFSVAFDVIVPDPVDAGTTFDNFADVRFDATQDGDAADPGELGTAGAAELTIATVYGSEVGPNGYPEGNAPTGTTYTSGIYTVGTDGDVSTVVDAYSGTTVTFTATLENTGNATDVFSLDLSGVPAGFTCTIYDAAGVTVITEQTVSGYDQVNVVVSCKIDPEFTPTTADFTVTLTATSQTDPAPVANTTTFVVDNVLDGFTVLLGNSDQNTGTDPDGTPDTQTTTPETTVTFPIEIKNDGQNPDSYDLTAVLPGGWTDGIYPDANCDGVADQTTSPITNTGTIDVGETACFVVLATPPAGTSPADYPVTIAAASTTQSGEADSITNIVTVQEVVAFQMSPDRTGTVTSPGQINYQHTITNNGNTAAVVSIPSNAPQGSFSYAYSLDGSTFFTSLSGISVAANGGTQTVFVQVTVLDGVADQTVNAVTVTANASFASGATDSDSVTDTTTVTIGVMDVAKTSRTFDGDSAAPTDCSSSTNQFSADGSVARPGDYLCYTIVAQNVGSANLTNANVSDLISTFTTFVSTSAASSGFLGGTVLWSTNGTSWSSIVPANVASGGTLYAGVDTNSDATITNADLMPPGANLTITLVVQVD